MLRKMKAADERSDWFTDAYFDLFVWWNEHKEITTFQLAYDKPGTERCLIWKRDAGASHAQIEDGEVGGRHKASPIMVQDGPLMATLADTFRHESAGIDPAIAAFVLEKIEEACHQSNRPTRDALAAAKDPTRSEPES